MLMILMAVATLIGIFFLLEMGRAERESIAQIVMCKSWANKFLLQEEKEKREKFLLDYNHYQDIPKKKAQKKVLQMNKNIERYEELEEAYRTGSKLMITDLIPLFGYQFMKDMKQDASNDMIRKLAKNCEHTGYVELEKRVRQGEEEEEKPEDRNEFFGDANSQIYAKYIYANLISYAAIAVFLGIIMVVITQGLHMEMMQTLLLSIAGIALPMLVGYLPYDQLNQKGTARQEEIDRDFPNALSKMALLSTAGLSLQNMIVQTSESGTSRIYMEFRNVVKDLNQGSTLAKALTRMQYRCDNRYIDRMVALLKLTAAGGNMKLAEDLRALNAECWLDKKHNSRRMAEVVQNKLFLPTILMFAGLLIVIVLPAMSGFQL